MNKVKWDKFDESITARCQEYTVNSANYIIVYNDLVDNINWALKDAGARLPDDRRAGGREENDSSPPPAPWWTPECSEEIEKRRQSCLDFRNAPSEENFDKYIHIIAWALSSIQEYALLVTELELFWDHQP